MLKLLKPLIHEDAQKKYKKQNRKKEGKKWKSKTTIFKIPRLH